MALFPTGRGCDEAHRLPIENDGGHHPFQGVLQAARQAEHILRRAADDDAVGFGYLLAQCGDCFGRRLHVEVGIEMGQIGQSIVDGEIIAAARLLRQQPQKPKVGGIGAGAAADGEDFFHGVKLLFMKLAQLEWKP